MATRGELEEVEGVDGAGLDTWDVAEALDKVGAVGGRVVDDQGTAALAVPAATKLTLTGTHGPRLLDLVKVSTGADGVQETDSGGSLGKSGTAESSRVDNQGNLGDVADPVTAGEQERGDGRSSESGGCSEAPRAKVSIVPLLVV